jgi:enoyl-CoA hydratase/carnithine racemase
LAFLDELGRLATEVLPTLAVEGLVVSGRGRHFSSGANLDELKKAISDAPANSVPQSLLAHGDTLRALEALPYPTVAAIDGCCLGSGFELALACHYRVSTPRALFALPEANFHLMPGCGATVRLPLLVGAGRAMELALTGRYLESSEALAWGAIDAVVPPAELLNAAWRLATHARVCP